MISIGYGMESVMNREIKFDAAFFVDAGVTSYVPNLSTSEIVDRIEPLLNDIKRAKKNRRLRDDTREKRVAEFGQVREALIAELCNRNRPAKIKLKIRCQERKTQSFNFVAATKCGA